MASLLENEIASQPDVVKRILEDETRHIEKIVAQIPAFDYALIAARGSSDHARKPSNLSSEPRGVALEHAYARVIVTWDEAGEVREPGIEVWPTFIYPETITF